MLHPDARCRWCGGRFRQINGWQWICSHEPCAVRQIAHAVERPGATLAGQSPYLFLPLPLQVDIEESPIKRLLVHGPAGISKSFGGRWHLYKRSRMVAGYRALLLRATSDELEKNHLQYMEAEAEQLGDAEFKRTPRPRMIVHHDGDYDSIVFMGYCEHDADVKVHMGPEYDEVLLEEAVHLVQRAVAEIPTRDRGSATARPARARLGLPQDGRSRLLTNPGGQAQMLIEDLYIARNPDREEYPEYDPADYGHITGDVEDNPYLPPGYRRRNLGGLSRARLAQLGYGRWDVVPGQFFPPLTQHVQAIEPHGHGRRLSSADELVHLQARIDALERAIGAERSEA